MKRLWIIVLTGLLVTLLGASAVVAAPPEQQIVTTGVVTTGLLNVRSAPTVNGAVLYTLPIGSQVGVAGRNADTSWYQIVTTAGAGWVNATYLSVVDAQRVPITVSSLPNTATASGYVNTGALNVRTVPSAVNNVPITNFPRSTRVSISGRSVDGQWYYVTVGDTVGWMRGRYIVVDTGNVAELPVLTQEAPTSPPAGTVYATGTVNTGALNIRTVPSPFFNTPLFYVYRGTAMNIIGRNANSTWYQVSLPSQGNTIGWVRSRYVQVTGGNPALAPVTG